MITACPCLDLEDADQKVVKIGVEDMPKPGTPTGEWAVECQSGIQSLGARGLTSQLLTLFLFRLLEETILAQ